MPLCPSGSQQHRGAGPPPLLRLVNIQQAEPLSVGAGGRSEGQMGEARLDGGEMNVMWPDYKVRNLRRHHGGDGAELADPRRTLSDSSWTVF